MSTGDGHVYNSIVYYNTATMSGDNWADQYDPGRGKYEHCCTTPAPDGAGHVTADPLFVDLSVTNLRLQAGSPCINAGLNEGWMFTTVDLDGRVRILNNVVDMGAYETPFILDLRVLLQGPYGPASSAMQVALAKTNALPNTSPYAADAREVSVLPANVTDWVLIHLRETPSAPASITRSVWVRSDGYLVTDAGERGVVVPVVEGKGYHITIQHRNHLGLRSRSPVPFVSSTASYDFTTGPDKCLDTTNACVQLAPDVWGMIAGDCDGDGKITAVDRTIVSNQVGKTGYLAGDVNLDGVVTEEDVP